MLNRLPLLCKVLSGVLLALFVFQVVRLSGRRSPLADLSFTPIDLKETVEGGATNAPAGATNAPVISSNATAKALAGAGVLTNAATNMAVVGTNVPAVATNGTNVAVTGPVAVGTNLANGAIAGTNAPAGVTTNAPGVVAVAGGRPPRSGPPGMPMGAMPPGMMMGGPPGRGQANLNLSPEAKARMDKIVQSEILGPVIRPQPMALIGIAGKDVFFRAPNGQTGLFREGEEMGGVKLLKVGVNRVLVEQDGQPKELMIFAGVGGESLLPKGK